MKFRPQVESLSERINPTATLDATTLYPYTPQSGGVLTTPVPIVTLDLTTQSIGSQPVSTSNIAYGSLVATKVGVNPRFAEIQKELDDLRQERNRLADALPTQIAVRKAFAQALNAVADVLRAEYARLAAAGWSLEQINNHQSIISLWTAYNAVNVNFLAADKAVNDTLAAIRANDAKANALFQEMIALAEADPNSVPPR